MFERILLGVGRRLVVPEWLFRPMVGRDAKKLAKRSKLEPDQRRIQHFAVREITHHAVVRDGEMGHRVFQGGPQSPASTSARPPFHSTLR